MDLLLITTPVTDFVVFQWLIPSGLADVLSAYSRISSPSAPRNPRRVDRLYFRLLSEDPEITT
jgi:hypothetical protein